MSSPQYSRMELPFGTPLANIHCPVCGQASMNEELGGASPCAHLAFIFVCETSGYEYQSDDHSQRLAKLGNPDHDLRTLHGLLVEAEYTSSLIAMELTYGGMACGPVWSTVVFGFDFSLQEESSDN